MATTNNKGKLPQTPPPMPDTPEELFKGLFRVADAKLEKKLGRPLKKKARQ